MARGKRESQPVMAAPAPPRDPAQPTASSQACASPRTSRARDGANKKAHPPLPLAFTTKKDGEVRLRRLPSRDPPGGTRVVHDEAFQRPLFGKQVDAPPSTRPLGSTNTDARDHTRPGSGTADRRAVANERPLIAASRAWTPRRDCRTPARGADGRCARGEGHGGAGDGTLRAVPTPDGDTAGRSLPDIAAVCSSPPARGPPAACS